MFGKQKISEGRGVSVSFLSQNGAVEGGPQVPSMSDTKGQTGTSHKGMPSTAHKVIPAIKGTSVCQCGGPLVRLGLCFSCSFLRVDHLCRLACSWATRGFLSGARGRTHRVSFARPLVAFQVSIYGFLQIRENELKG